MEAVSRINYKPGRTEEEAEREGLRIASKTTYEERIMQLLQMIEVSQLLKNAKAEIVQSQKLANSGHLQ